MLFINTSIVYNGCFFVNDTRAALFFVQERGFLRNCSDVSVIKKMHTKNTKQDKKQKALYKYQNLETV